MIDFDNRTKILDLVQRVHYFQKRCYPVFGLPIIRYKNSPPPLPHSKNQKGGGGVSARQEKQRITPHKLKTFEASGYQTTKRTCHIITRGIRRPKKSAAPD